MGRITGRDLFRQRALREAERYGPDRWVFVRELVQNARDAGAARIRVTVAGGDAGCRVEVEDDGDGMTREHAERFLFVLYSSSKGGDPEQAGRFGVGFWSVLKIGPRHVSVASRPRHGAPWGLRFDGALGSVEPVDGPAAPGTTVTLELSADAGTAPEVSGAITEAARRDARFITRRGSQELPLSIEIDGVRINEPLALPAPSVAFSEGRIRGVVGLGSVGGVELHARGLLVRSAATLGDLLSPRSGGDGEEEPPVLPGRLLPRIVVCCDDLEALLARGDVREDRTLRRVVASAGRELDRLVLRQLRVACGASIVECARDRLLEALWRRRRPLVAAAVACTLAAAAASAASALLRGAVPPTVSGIAGAALEALAPASSRSATRPYEDLAARYSGPVADLPAGLELPFDVQYWPADEAPLLAALRVTDLAAERSWDGLPRSSFAALGGEPCEGGCLSVLLRATAGEGPLRLPVATGHVIDPASVRLVPARDAPLLQSPEGQPCVWLAQPFEGTVTYVTGPGPSTIPAIPDPPPLLPAEAEQLMPPGGLSLSLPPEERVERVLALARRAFRYDRSPEVARSHRRSAEVPLLARAFATGAGDCDIVNGALVQMLQGAGIPARLAVGFVGRGGRAIPGLHAWAEVPTAAGWSALDVTTVTGDRPPAPDAVPSTFVDGSSPVAPLASPSSDVRAPGPAAPRQRRSLLLAAVPVALAGVAWRMPRRARVRRSDVLDAHAGLAGLLAGLLTDPDAFGGAARLAQRPVVPLLGRRRISLERAREISRGGRLAASWSGDGPGAVAAARGATVIDGRDEAGDVVARALGAVDLDAWQAPAPLPIHEELSERCNRVLASTGEAWEVEIAPGSEVEVRDGRAFRLGARRIRIGAEDPLVHGASELFRSRPESAVLLVLERLFAAGELPGNGAEILSEQAWQVLAEESRR